MKTIQLTEQQFGWLKKRIFEEYSKAWAESNTLRTPSEVSFYRRNDAEDIRIRSIEDYERTMRFCQELNLVLIKAEERL